MNERKPRVSDRRGEYDEVTYREALRSLGLFAPVQPDDIHRAYRSRAKQIHPDRFAANGGYDEATHRIQKLNAAHEYVIHFYATFEKSQGRIARHYMPPGQAGPMNPLFEVLLFPIAAVYSFTTVLAAVPAALLDRFSAEDEGENPAEEDGTDVNASEKENDAVNEQPDMTPSREGWLVVGPHVMALVLFMLVESSGIAPRFFKWWVGLSLLIMLSTDIASRVTGEENPLRDHRAFGRVDAFVRSL
jgi:hypothetical protein